MTEIPELILASQSPRRAALLKQMGFSFRVLTGDNDESSVALTDPVELSVTLSRLKAEAVQNQISSGVIIGADTIVHLNGVNLGKPKDEADAIQMLQRLSGKTHHVFTGFTLLEVGGRCVSDVERTAVTFRDLSDWEIEDYVQTGGPMDKAGGYGIQDRSGLFVDRIDGCFYNVVGFPLTQFYEGLKKLFPSQTIRQMHGGGS